MSRITENAKKFLGLAIGLVIFGYGAKYAFIVEPTDWSKTNRGFLAKSLKDEPEKIANKIVEQSRATWPQDKPVDDTTIIKMKVDLAACIEIEIKKLLSESKDPILKRTTSPEDQETLLKPILQKCVQ